jgi:nucleoside-diphosphate-sugar epimerase
LTGLELDLEHVLARTTGIWEEFAGASIFITGGTGFFGHWLLSSFVAANDRFGLRSRVVVLTRDADGFRRRAPALAAHPAVSFHAGDVRTFEFPQGRFSHIIHGATQASEILNTARPLEMQDTIIQGTRRVLDFAQRCSAAKLLLCSSGAVYGHQPPELELVPEDYTGGPDCLDPRSAYAEGKRVSELLCATYSHTTGFETKITRGFAFIGPHFPLDIHFAIGNFLRDAMAERPIVIRGDGTPYRSYLYAADLTIWLWTILVRGQSCRAYNVGSESAINIADLARLVAATIAPETPVQVLGAPIPGRLPERYVPSTLRARSELGLQEYIDLADAIRRTAAWHRLMTVQQ